MAKDNFIQVNLNLGYLVREIERDGVSNLISPKMDGRDLLNLLLVSNYREKFRLYLGYMGLYPDTSVENDAFEYYYEFTETTRDFFYDLTTDKENDTSLLEYESDVAIPDFLLDRWMNKDIAVFKAYLKHKDHLRQRLRIRDDVLRTIFFKIED